MAARVAHIAKIGASRHLISVEAAGDFGGKRQVISLQSGT
jgi:hypothetical protein